MSEWREKHNKERQMLIYAITLGESNLSTGILANNSQLGWCVVLIRSLPSLLDELGILRISDQRDFWMKMISNWIWVSSIVLMMSEFFQTFCKNILRFCKIIVEVRHSSWSKLTWPYFHGSQCISSVATLCWTNASRTDIDLSQLGGLPNSLNIWTCVDMVPLSLFQVEGGLFLHLPCSTIQIHNGFMICEDHCIWHT